MYNKYSSYYNTTYCGEAGDKYNDKHSERLAHAKGALVFDKARRDSAEHLITTKTPCYTATAWTLIVAQCFAAIL